MPGDSGFEPDIVKTSVEFPSRDSELPEDRGQILRSWKEIAAYLQRDPRTVQRWEKTESLPVHRLVHSSGGSVYAFTADLDAWILSRTRTSAPQSETLASDPEIQVLPSQVPPSTEAHPQQSPAPFLRYALVAAALLVTGTFILLWYQRANDERAQPVFNPTLLTSLVGYEESPSFSPDGTQLAFAWITEDPTRFKVLVKSMNNGEDRQLTPDELNGFSPAWSPDGSRIAFLSAPSLTSEVSLWLMDVNSRKPIKVADTGGDGWPWYRTVSWSADAKSVLTVGRAKPDDTNSLFLYSLAAPSLKRRVTAPPAGYSDNFPSISPDGRTALFTRFGKGSAALYQTSLTPTNGSPALLFRECFRNASSLASCWSPSGDAIFIAANIGGVGQIWRAKVRNHDISAPRLLASMPQNIFDLTLGKSAGELVFSTEVSDANLWRVSLESPVKTPRRDGGSLNSTRNELAPQYSPDGTQIAFESNRSGAWQIWVAQRDGSQARAVTHFGGQVTGSPSWSPDGKWLAFDSRAGGTAQIFVVPAAGGEPRQITSGNQPNVVPSWSHDGHWIYFASFGGQTMQIWKVRPDGQERIQFTHDGGFEAQESKDGRFVYYTKSHQLITSLWRVPSSGGQEVFQVGSVVDRDFAVGARGIFYASAADSLSAPTLFFRDFNSKTAAPILRFAAPIAYGLALSPDERELSFAEHDSHGSDLHIVRGIR